MLKKRFPEATVLQYEQSQANLWIAVSQMDVPIQHCHCVAIQNVKWELYEDMFDVVVDWWTLSYLDLPDVGKVLRGLKIALGSRGFLVLCLPVINR